MNPCSSNPAISAFIDHLNPSVTFGQAVVSRQETSFEVRHSADAEKDTHQLELLTPRDLRSRISKDAAGRFRPLQSAPDLLSGWKARASSSADLWEILNILYPGGVGDWYANARQSQTTVSYRDFVNRQSGMFRGAAKLQDAEAAQVANACCADQHCIKNRLWDISGNMDHHSIETPRLVCLEPCQILLELARRQFKLGQSPSTTLELPEEEVALVLVALDHLSKVPRGKLRTGDLSMPMNPRRMNLLQERLQAQIPRQTEKAANKIAQ
ncbi:MAG: hypothetical protein M2R45_02426 [Verrucomicrobia subdivision 3 bacterium]|nr:hypothetical protein [Limisphaerales bacterium]MCS1416369.1 hypothetical protein [Limisphaerales bacterium]